MPSTNSWGVTSRALRLAVLEPRIYKRKANVFIPLGIIVIFAAWALAAAPNAPHDNRSLIILLLQLGGIMSPLLIGSTVLILVNEDKETSMAARKQSFGIELREIGFSKSVWVYIAAYGGLFVLTSSLVAISPSIGLEFPENYLTIILFGLAAEVLCLVPLFLNLAFRRRGQATVLALALGGSLLGSLSNFLPPFVAAITPFTMAGAVSPVRLNADEIFDTSVSLALPFLVLAISLCTTVASVAFFPRRTSND